jgi:hypothetical protein
MRAFVKQMIRVMISDRVVPARRLYGEIPGISEAQDATSAMGRLRHIRIRKEHLQQTALPVILMWQETISASLTRLSILITL